MQECAETKEQTLNIYMYGINQEIAQLFMKSEEMILPSLFESKVTVQAEQQLEITKEVECKLKNTTQGFAFVTSAAEATSRSGINS